MTGDQNRNKKREKILRLGERMVGNARWKRAQRRLQSNQIEKIGDGEHQPDFYIKIQLWDDLNFASCVPAHLFGAPLKCS